MFDVLVAGCVDEGDGDTPGFRLSIQVGDIQGIGDRLARHKTVSLGETDRPQVGIVGNDLGTAVPVTAQKCYVLGTDDPVVEGNTAARRERRVSATGGLSALSP